MDTTSSTNHPTKWLWSFGDGTTSTAQNPTHTYRPRTADVDYLITLTTQSKIGTSVTYGCVAVLD